jgi:hypothetical protein
MVGFSPTGTISSTTVQAAIAELSTELTATSDASGITYTPDGTGAVATTVQGKLRESVSVKDYGAVGDGSTDDSAAFLAAQTASYFVEVPANFICQIDNSTGLNTWQFYGAGVVYENGRTWQLSRSPQSSQTQKVYRDTFGTFESAAGSSVVVNRGTGQQQTATEVEGVTTPGVAQYQGFDHVGFFAAAYSFPSQIYPGSGAIYTTTTLTQAGLSAFVVERGMLIKTSHATWFVGKVVSKAGDTITVDGWYAQATGIAAIPANGTGGIINPNTKIWVHNANLHLPATGNADSGTGFELGLLCDKTGSGANTVGFDVITLSGEDSKAHYESRGNTTDGYHSSNATQASFHASQSTSLGGSRYGFFSETAKTGFLSSVDTNAFVATNATGAALQVNKDGVTQSNINSDGQFTRLRLKTADYGVGGTISDDVTFAVAVGATINLPATIRGDGHTVFVTNQTGGVVTVGGNTHTISGAASTTINSLEGRMFVSFGGNWLLTVL